MNIDDAIEHLKRLDAPPEAIERLERAALQLPDTLVHDLGGEEIPHFEGMTNLIELVLAAITGSQPRGVRNRFERRREVERQTASGGAEDEGEDWQKALWKEHPWKK